MNCKEGDLVVVVRSEVGNEGRFGVVVSRAVAKEALPNGVEVYDDDDWIVAGRFNTGDEVTLSFCGVAIERWTENVREVDALAFPDSSLRPIRDNDGEDEMLRIAGKPQEVNA